MLSYMVRTRRTHPSPRGVALGLALLAVSAAPGLAQETTPMKVGVINLEAVALQSPSGQALQEQLVTFQEQFTTDLQSRQEAARVIEQRVAEAESLSVDDQRALEREYQDALTEFQRFQQDKQEEATALRADGLARIQQEIAPIIEQIQAELGYDLVFNSTSTAIVIFSERVDITQLVIERLASGS